MHLLVYGPGRLGSAIAGAAIAAGWPAPTLVGRAVHGRRNDALPADVVVDASHGDGVVANLEHALAGGNRAFVLAATGWDADVARVRERLLGAGAAAGSSRPTSRWVPRCSCAWPRPPRAGMPRRARSSRRSSSGTAAARRTGRPAPHARSHAGSPPRTRAGPGRTRPPATRPTTAPRARGVRRPGRCGARHAPGHVRRARESRSSSASRPATAPRTPTGPLPPRAGSSRRPGRPACTRSTPSSTTSSSSRPSPFPPDPQSTKPEGDSSHGPHRPLRPRPRTRASAAHSRRS